MEFQSQKDKIMYYAKAEFYKNGYSKATLKNIAESAETNSGLILYHYKAKEQLARCIYTDFYRKIEDRVDEYVELNINNALYRQILVSYIYYGIIFGDPNNTRFYSDISNEFKSNRVMHQEITDIVYHNYVKDFNLSVSKKDFQVYLIMGSGARALFFRNYLNGNIDVDLQEMVHYVESIMPRLMGIDQKTIDSYLLRADHTIKEIEYSDIKFLL